MKYKILSFVIIATCISMQQLNAQNKTADTIPARNIIIQHEQKGDDKTADEIKKKELTITPSTVILKDEPKKFTKKKKRCFFKKKKQ